MSIYGTIYEVPEGSVKHLAYEASPCRISLLAVAFSAVSLTVLFVLCCRRPRKTLVVRLLPEAIPNAALKTSQDERGIIHPDVMFFAPDGSTCAAVSTAVPGSTANVKAFETFAGDHGHRVSTPIRPLHPAYQPTQPVNVHAAHHAVLRRDSSTELTLPPGYISQRNAKMASVS
ncbi:uncharacterized protein LOC135367544 [Ornithodoros turicata]|uniref:uncharacterized protein LOC135367544 n=1 Tax=Ornithodoros turicata TaxID=34597 RepID=UPI00313A311E